MVLGYSTHGHWASFKEVKELEVKDRGNPWVDPEGTEGIWVAIDPRDAVRYLFMASELESEEYREALKHPEKYLCEVNLTGALPVHQDGDGGVLYIRKKGGVNHVEPTTQRTISQNTQTL